MEFRKVTKHYFIDTGAKSDFYTLWCETEVDMRPRDEKGNVIQEGRKTNFYGEPMDYFMHVKYLRNLSKTKEGAIEKIKELIDMCWDDGRKRYPELSSILKDDTELFDLRHNTKPSLEAFGTRLKFNKGKWYAKATDSFFQVWRRHKEEMKKEGWSCWFYKGNSYLRIESCWYMGYKEPDFEMI